MKFLLDVGISPRLGELLEGALVLMEPSNVRVRMLPIQ